MFYKKTEVCFAKSPSNNWLREQLICQNACAFHWNHKWIIGDSPLDDKSIIPCWRCVTSPNIIKYDQWLSYFKYLQFMRHRLYECSCYYQWIWARTSVFSESFDFYASNPRLTLHFISNIQLSAIPFAYYNIDSEIGVISDLHIIMMDIVICYQSCTTDQIDKFHMNGKIIDSNYKCRTIIQNSCGWNFGSSQ